MSPGPCKVIVARGGSVRPRGVATVCPSPVDPPSTTPAFYFLHYGRLHPWRGLILWVESRERSASRRRGRCGCGGPASRGSDGKARRPHPTRGRAGPSGVRARGARPVCRSAAPIPPAATKIPMMTRPAAPVAGVFRAPSPGVETRTAPSRFSMPRPRRHRAAGETAVMRRAGCLRCAAVLPDGHWREWLLRAAVHSSLGRQRRGD